MKIRISWLHNIRTIVILFFLTFISVSDVISVNEVIPSHYDIFIDTDIDKDIFHGRVSITIEALQADLSKIKLDSQDILIEDYELIENTTVGPGIKHDKDMIILSKNIFEFVQPLKKGSQCRISFRFTGKIEEEQIGYYKTLYDNKKMYNTQFQLGHTRRMFPCFDRPDRKATFKLSLIVPKGYEALSNTQIETKKDIIKEVIIDGNCPEFDKKILYGFFQRVKENTKCNNCRACNNNEVICLINPLEDFYYVEFEMTPIMSTFNLSFLIAELSFIDLQIEENIEIRMWLLNEDDKKNVDFIFKISKRLIKMHNIYFKIKYIMKKLDLILLSSKKNEEKGFKGFSVWGIIYFDMKGWNYDSNRSFIRDQYSIIYLICNYLVLDWIGNLVSILSWNDMWFNYALSSFISDFIINEENYIDADISAYFINEKMFSSLVKDSTSSLALNSLLDYTNKNAMGDIKQMINKGTCLVKMLENIVGHKIFMQSIQKYISKYQFRNAKPSNFWDILDETYIQSIRSNFDVKISFLMEIWTKNKKFPLIRVKKGNSNDKILIIQEIFNCKEDIKYEYRWDIPIRICYLNKSQDPISDDEKNNLSHEPNTRTKLNPSLYFMKNQMETIDISDKYLFKLNDEAVGFYIVFYEDQDMVINLLRHPGLSARNKINLINDQYMLYLVSKIKYDTILKDCEALINDNNHEVLRRLLFILDCLYNHDHERIDALKLLLSIVEKHINSIKSNKEKSFFDIKHEFIFSNEIRTYNVLEFGIKHGHDESIQLLNDAFMNFLEDPIKINPIFHVIIFEAITKRHEQFRETLVNFIENENDLENIIMEYIEHVENYRKFIALKDDLKERNIMNREKITKYTNVLNDTIIRAEILNFINKHLKMIFQEQEINDILMKKLIVETFPYISDKKIFINILSIIAKDKIFIRWLEHAHFTRTSKIFRINILNHLSIIDHLEPHKNLIVKHLKKSYKNIIEVE